MKTLKHLFFTSFTFFLSLTVSLAQGDQAPVLSGYGGGSDGTSYMVHLVFSPATALPVTIAVDYYKLPSGPQIEIPAFVVTSLVVDFAIENVEPNSTYSSIINCTNSYGYIEQAYEFTTDPVGITETETNRFNLFPNPMVSELFIENGKIGEQITISNMIGNTVRADVIHDNKKQDIMVGDLPAGIYLVTVGTKTQRVLKK